VTNWGGLTQTTPAPESPAVRRALCWGGGGLEGEGGTAVLGVKVIFLGSGVDCRNIRGIWGLRNLLRPLLQLGPHSRRRII
jgi:hypothetical protein